MALPRRTGRNRGRYHGDSINIDTLQHRLLRDAAALGWEKETYFSGEDRELCFLSRTRGNGEKRIYLSSGIHGDEPAGPLAMHDLVRRDSWPENAEIVLFPCLNPTGFRNNSRENAEGIDLNRDYLSLRASETRAHVELLERFP